MPLRTCSAHELFPSPLGLCSSCCASCFCCCPGLCFCCFSFSLLLGSFCSGLYVRCSWQGRKSVTAACCKHTCRGAAQAFTTSCWHRYLAGPSLSGKQAQVPSSKHTKRYACSTKTQTTTKCVGVLHWCCHPLSRD